MEGVTAADRCPRCDHSVFAEDRYCSKCGTKLPGVFRKRPVEEHLRQAWEDPRVRQVAGGAALGAAAGFVLPVVTTGLGLVAGVAYAGYKVLRKD